MARRGIIFISSSTLNADNVFLNTHCRDIEKLRKISRGFFSENVWLHGKFRKPIDVVNHYLHGAFYDDADYPTRRILMDVKNPAGFNSLHFANLFEDKDIEYGIINNLDSEMDRFIEMYQSMKPKPVVGLSATFIINWFVLRRCVSALLSVDPEMTIVAGGAMFPTMLHDGAPEQWKAHMRRAHLKAVFFAQCSEYDLLDFLSSQQDDEDLRKLSNIAWFDAGGEFHINPARRHPPLLSDFPIHYDRVKLDFPFRSVALRSAFGCPFSCAYCNYPAIAKVWKRMDLTQFDAMLGGLAATGKVRNIIMNDDTFNVPVERTRALCKIFGKYDFRWYSNIRPQYIDDETAGMLADSGYVAGTAGIESGSDLMLRNMNKKATTAQIAAGIENLSRAGIRTMGFFLIGFPGETEETAAETERFIENSGIDFYQIFQYTFVPTQGMEGMIAKYHLSGSFSDWRHDTMDYPETGRIKNGIFKRVKSAVHIQEGLIPHVMMMQESGIGWDETKSIYAAINSVVSDQMDGVFLDEPPALRRVEQKLLRCSDERGKRISRSL